MAEQNNNNDFLAEYRRRQQERWAQEQKSQANAPPAEQKPQLIQEEINAATAPQQQAPNLQPHQEQHTESLDELRQNFADRFRAAVQEADNDPILVEDDAELNEVDKFWSDEQVKIQQEQADEEYARKLQAEFDAEMAEAVQQAEIQQGEAPQQNNHRPPLQEPFVDRLVNDENDYMYQQQEVPIVHDNRRAARVPQQQQQEGYVNINQQQQQFAQQYSAANNQGNNNNDDVIIVQHHNRVRRLPVQQQVSNQNPYMFVQQQQQAAAPQQQGNSYKVYEQVTQTYNQNGEPIRIKRVVTNHNGNVTSQEFIEPLSVNQQQYFQRYPFVQQQQSRVSFAPQQQFVQQQQQILNNGSNSFAGNDDFFNGFEPMSRSMQRMAQTMQASRRRFSSMFNM